jgi:hypothetical protein
MQRESRLDWRKQRQSSIIFFLVALILAIVGAIEKILPSWALSIGAAAIAAAGVTVARLQQQAARRDTRAAMMRGAMAGITEKGTLPQARSVSYEDLGVVSFSRKIPYLERSIESKASEILKNSKPLLVVGPGLSGKSRLAAELMKKTYPEREVLIPLSAGSFQDFLKSMSSVVGSVIWLDSLDAYLQDKALDRQLISKLSSNGNAIIATIDERSFAGFYGSAVFPGQKDAVLRCFEVVHLRNRHRENVKHSLAFERTDDADIVKEYGVAGLAGGLPIVRSALAVTQIADPRAFRLLHTVYSWHQAGLSWIHQDALIPLLGGLQSKSQPPLSLTDVQVIAAKFDAIPLVPKIIERSSEWYRVPSYVIDFFLQGDHSGIPAKVWEAALTAATATELPMLGHLALVHHHKQAVAERAWLKAAEAGDGYSMWNLGMMLERNRNRRDEGFEWLQKAASAKYVDSYGALAHAYSHRKMQEQGIYWFKMAANAGDLPAMIQVGHLFEKSGDEKEALWWYDRATESGSSAAQYKMSQLLRRSGSKSAADKLLEQSSDPRAVKALIGTGLDAYWRGEVEVARGIFLKAAANKSARAFKELAYTYLNEGNIAAAAENYRKAADLGDACGMTGLGYIAMEVSKDKVVAERWLRQAAQYGCQWSMYYLGCLSDEAGDGKSEFWYRGAAKKGNAEAMFQLGLIFESKFDYKTAEKWYKKAGQVGHVVAVSSLAALLLSNGREDEAEYWSDSGDLMLTDVNIRSPQTFLPPSCDL